MNKPKVIVHMMMSLNGRIDCSMTEQLRRTDEYYSTLEKLSAPTRISGRVTAATEMTNGDRYVAQSTDKINQTGFKQNTPSDRYNIVVDTKGSLRWPAENDPDFPHLIITSEQASQEYLHYLDQQGISWISTGKERIDLTQAMDILANQFGTRRLAVVGGGKINGGFLKAGLVDEISVVVGPGIDGRIGQPNLFDGIQSNQVTSLQLKSVQSFDDGAVWLRYTVLR